MTDHYVYAYFDPYNGVPVYLGAGSGPRWKQHLITFPRPRLDTTKLNPNEKFMISIDNEHCAFWRSVASQLDADPKARIKLPIS